MADLARRLAGCLALVALALAGCGGAPGPEQPAPQATGAPSTATAAPQATRASPAASPPPPTSGASPAPPAPSADAAAVQAARAAQTPAAEPVPPRSSAAATAPTPPEARYSYPIGRPGRPLGDGFIIRHGAGVENTWYAPGHWHTGEDWYAVEGDTGGAGVYAVAAGEVVYAGSNYPGRVVIVLHDDGLYAMYGHLDPDLAVGVGDRVGRGKLLGTVLARSDGRAPSHLHFEIRSFLLEPAVNGAAPRYGFRCGPNCAPGPGYWPIDAPELPGDLGWLNPTHVIARRMAGEAAGVGLGVAVVAAAPITPSLALWSAPPDDPRRRELAAAPVRGGERLQLLDVWAGPEALTATSALGYTLWYRVRLSDGVVGWAQAALPLAAESGADGRPSSVALTLLPDVTAGGGSP